MMDVRALGIKGDWYEISQARQQWTSVCEQICVSVGVGEVCAANRSSLIQVFLCTYGAFLPAVRPGCARPRAAPVFSQSMYNRRIHESAVPKKIHPLRYGLSFHPLLLDFLLKKGENSQKTCR